MKKDQWQWIYRVIDYAQMKDENNYLCKFCPLYAKECKNSFCDKTRRDIQLKIEGSKNIK